VLLASCFVSVFESVYRLVSPGCGRAFCPRVAAGLACGSTVCGPGGRGGSSFLTGSGPDGRLGEAGRENGDLRFPGDDRLGRGGVREFRACFLRPLGVPLASGDVEGVQGGEGGAVGCGGERLQ
jgi:hypothetical protein